LFGGVARHGIYVRSGFRLWSYQPYLSLLLVVRQSRLLYDATFIWDNRIIVAPSALISMPGRQMKKDTAHIAQERMYMTFGDVAQTM
jgi:hypothetical protein